MPYSDQLQAEISQTDGHIRQLRDELGQSRRALVKLQELHRYMTTKRTEFTDRHNASRTNLRIMQGSEINSKSLAGYGEAMQETLYGNLANNVYAEYDDAVNHITAGIRQAEDEIGDLTHAISNSEAYRTDQVQHFNRVKAEEDWEAEQDRKKMEARRRGEC